MIMTNGEIVHEYRTAKRKKDQIQILADQNMCSKDDIIAILVESGIPQKVFAMMFAPKPHRNKKPKEATPEQIPAAPAKTGMTRSEILQTAEKMVCGHREQDYGSPEDNFTAIANLWSTYLDTAVCPVDVAVMMCLFKIARISTGTATADSWVDLAGYAACGGEIATRKAGDQ